MTQVNSSLQSQGEVATGVQIGDFVMGENSGTGKHILKKVSSTRFSIGFTITTLFTTVGLYDTSSEITQLGISQETDNTNAVLAIGLADGSTLIYRASYNTAQHQATF